MIDNESSKCDLMSIKLFDLKQNAQLPKFSADEKISCVSGSANFMYIGTTIGRIVCIELTDGAVKEIICLPTKIAIVDLITATAVDRLIALSSFTIFLIEITTLKVLNSSSLAIVLCISMNANPVVDDPFTIQLALGTTKSLVLICNLTNEELNIRHKVAYKENVLKIAYNKLCVCCATATCYFLYNIADDVIHILFPYDKEIIEPLIIDINNEEFLLNGMQGLGVFVTTQGVSSRPPLFWGSVKVLSIAFRYPHIFVLTTNAIYIFEFETKIEVQHISLCDGHLLNNSDGEIILFHECYVSILKKVRWIDKIEMLLLNNQIEGALKLLENEIMESPLDEYQLLELYHIKQKASLICFHSMRFEDCLRLCISSEIDPREILINYTELLPLPSLSWSKSEWNNFSSDINISSSTVHLEFLKKFLKTVRQEKWANEYIKDIDAFMLRISSMEHDFLQKNDLNSFDCSYSDNEFWLNTKNKEKFLLSLAFVCGEYEIAFGLLEKIYNSSAIESDLLDVCINCTDLTIETNLFNWLHHLLKSDTTNCIQKIGYENLMNVSFEKLCEVMKPYPKYFIQYLENIYVRSEDRSIAIILINCYSKQILYHDNEEEKKSEKYRTSLRQLIMKTDGLDYKDISVEMEKNPLFTVEYAIIVGKEDPSKCLDELLLKYADFDAAELFCSYMEETHKNLYPTLLSFYLESLRKYPEFEGRIIRLLQNIKSNNSIHIIGEIPHHWPFSTLAAYASKAVVLINNWERTDRMKNAILIKAEGQLNRYAHNIHQKSIMVDDQTNCKTCRTTIGNEAFVRCPQSGHIFHRTCWKRNNIF